MAGSQLGPRVGILLAAGMSRRFGPDDKLSAPFAGKPLICHAAAALRAAGLDHLIAVLRSPAIAALLDGFAPIYVPDDGVPQSVSLRTGVAAAQRMGAQGVLVALGDMPKIPAAHLRALIQSGEIHGCAATDGGRRLMPPAWFSSEHFAALDRVEGDQGARPLLQKTPAAARIPCDPAWLIDVDRPEDIPP